MVSVSDAETQIELRYVPGFFSQKDKNFENASLCHTEHWVWGAAGELVAWREARGGTSVSSLVQVWSCDKLNLEEGWILIKLI